MLYRITAKGIVLSTRIYTLEGTLSLIKEYDSDKRFRIISVEPATAYDLAEYFVGFSKDVCPFDYEDIKEFGETDEDMIKKIEELIIESKDTFCKLLEDFLSDPAIIDNSEGEAREYFLNLAKNF